MAAFFTIKQFKLEEISVDRAQLLHNKLAKTAFRDHLYNNMLAQGTVTNDDDDVGLHEYSC